MKLKKIIIKFIESLPYGRDRIKPALKILLKGENKNYRIEGLAENRCYKSKIFIVGNNKTGTTSLEEYFTLLGYRVAPQSEAEKITFSYYYNDKDVFFKKIWGFIDTYEVFQDIPFSYRDFLGPLLKEYPESKFIYTERDSDDWYLSLLNHCSQESGFKCDIDYSSNNKSAIFDSEEAIDCVKNWHYQGNTQVLDRQINRYGLVNEYELFDEKKYKEYHKSHYANAKDLLINRNSIFINIMKDKDSYIKLGEFLNLPEKLYIPIPKKNQRRPE